MAKGSILIIDDEVDLTNLIALHLKSKGYDTHTAYTGVEGLAMLNKIDPDLIILDLNMPEMGGIEFYNQICDKHGKPKYSVFVFTGRGDMEAIFNDFEIDGFITKPFDLKELSEKISAVMEKKFQHAEFLEKKNENTSRKLLIIDDDPNALVKIAQIFIDNGYSVHCAKSQEEAIKEFKNTPPNLTLIKFNMQDVPGDQLHMNLQQVNKKVPAPALIYIPNGVQYNTNMFRALSFRSHVEAVMEYFSPQELFKKVNALFKE